MTSRFASLNEQETEKIVEDKESQNTKKVDEGGKGAVFWLRETEKTERTWDAKVLYRSKKEFVQCKIKQLLDSVFVLSRIIKVSVKGYQPQSSASADNSYMYLHLDYSGYHKNLLYSLRKQTFSEEERLRLSDGKSILMT